MASPLDPNDPPQSVKLLTTAGSAEQASESTIGSGVTTSTVLPKLAYVAAGGDSLTLHFGDGTSAQFAAATGSMLPGGWDGFDSASDTSGIILVAFY